MELRDYQQNLLDKAINAMRAGNRRVLICLPTGGGKTAIASDLIKRCTAKGKRSIFCCHRQELLKQTANTYKNNGIEPAFIKSGMPADINNPCQIASINTLVNRLDSYRDIDVLFMDEAHHTLCNTWANVVNNYPNAFVVGLSATPCRTDGKPLKAFFDTMVQEISTAELIKRGYLTPFKYYAPTVFDEQDLVLGSNGEYTKESVLTSVSKSKIIGNNIETYLKYCNGKRNVVFAVSREHGRRVCEEYNSAGIATEFLDGETPDKEREETLSRFAEGKTKVLVNVDLFGEGYDLPAIEVVSLLRPTHSTALYLQQVGRALRICPEINKTEAIILDHVNNYQRHGLPDEDREWTLESKVSINRAKSNSVAIKRCPVCFFAHKPALVCPNCGHVYESDGKMIKQIAGELVLVGSQEEKDAKKKEIYLANDLQTLVELEKKYDYACGWAEKQWQIKSGENLWCSRRGLEQIRKARGYSEGWVFTRMKLRKG